MKSIEVVARTVDEAIAEALHKLQADREEVEVTILDEGNKGFLGILGSKQAKVLVEKKSPLYELKLERALEFVKELLAQMEIPAEVVGEANLESVNLQIQGDGLGVLIGRRGQTLESLQYITSLAVNRQGGDWIRINLDIGDYRAKREETLRSLAQRAAMKVESTGRRVALDAMNAAERRIVHQELQEFGGVITQSEGQEPYRRVVILPD
ncbi:MAG: RNA-binding cell elongation regulator Jag/EloR [Bacillota bacterium]|jgi:spoIIIJ-associated protein|nr:RNA-binding cell elongation regulator Jag/EloR [Bacillota bacterium]HHT89890.1 protein jag [Bacillota bacterium]